MDINNIISNLKKRRIEALYFENKESVISQILSEINYHETIAIGGSVTIDSLGLYDTLKEKGNNVLWHWKVPKEDRMELLKKAIFSDFYLTSCNALIEDGRIVNIDGTGNRVAAMFFGPKKVRIIVGINKIAKDYDSAIERIKTVACPKNARRLDRKTPCASQDKCFDCKGEDRMCMVTTIIESKPPTIDFKVYIVGEELGY